MAEQQREANWHPSICYLPHINLRRLRRQAPPYNSFATLPARVRWVDNPTQSFLFQHPPGHPRN
nr:MAG TPA: hypothetical protein [Caudoviricetes sp.]